MWRYNPRNYSLNTQHECYGGHDQPLIESNNASGRLYLGKKYKLYAGVNKTKDLKMKLRTDYNVTPHVD